MKKLYFFSPEFMRYSEENLLKLLNYENIEISSLLHKISLTLDIQYFEDGGVFTLGSKHFVLDINKQIKIFYVDDTLTEKFLYVEFYLTHFFVNKEFVLFYNHLKFFINFLESSNTNTVNLRNSPELCACVGNFNYCDIYNIPILKGEFTFNIFTHRYEYHQYKEIFVSIPEHLHNKEKINLSECYQPKFVNRKVLEFFKDSFYEGIIDNCRVLVDKGSKIYLNDVYDLKKSFMFKRGVDLLSCFKTEF